MKHFKFTSKARVFRRPSDAVTHMEDVSLFGKLLCQAMPTKPKCAA